MFRCRPLTVPIPNDMTKIISSALRQYRPKSLYTEKPVDRKVRPHRKVLDPNAPESSLIIMEQTMPKAQKENLMESTSPQLPWTRNKREKTAVSSEALILH